MQRERDFDDILRRVLRTATDSIEPSGDGLERIRARLTTPRPLPAAWLMAGYSDVALPALVRLCSAVISLRGWRGPGAASRSAQSSFAAHSRQPGGFRGPGWWLRGRLALGSGSHRYGWLRPAAVAAAIVVAVAGGYALTQLQRTISSTGAEILQLAPGKTHPSGGSADSSAASRVPGPSGTPSATPAPSSAAPSPSATCSPGSTPRLGSHPAATTTPSSSPTPTPTPSPSSSSSPSQTPSGTPTSTPSSTGGSTEDPAATLAAASAELVRPAEHTAPAASPRSTTKSSPPIEPCGSGNSTGSPG